MNRPVASHMYAEDVRPAASRPPTLYFHWNSSSSSSSSRSSSSSSSRINIIVLLLICPALLNYI